MARRVVDGSRPGGRSARVRRDVLDATLAVFLEEGVDGVSIAAIARRAGVHESSIYRRWGTRDQLAIEALLDSIENAVPIPDTGNLAEDLERLLDLVIARLGTPVGSALLQLSVAAGRTDEGSPHRATYWANARERTCTVIDRAIARGELPEGTPTWPIVEAVLSPLYFRLLVTGQEVEPGFAAQAVAAVLGPRGSSAGGDGPRPSRGR